MLHKLLVSEMYAYKALVVSLFILLLSTETELWRRRRRRRRPPPCPVRDCILSSWSNWSGCTHQCGNSGTMTRTKTIDTYPSCGGRSCPYPLSDSPKRCNRDKCRNGGTPRYGYCSCRPGYQGTCCEAGELQSCGALT